MKKVVIHMMLTIVWHIEWCFSCFPSPQEVDVDDRMMVLLVMLILMISCGGAFQDGNLIWGWMF